MTPAGCRCAEYVEHAAWMMSAWSKEAWELEQPWKQYTCPADGKGVDLDAVVKAHAAKWGSSRKATDEEIAMVVRHAADNASETSINVYTNSHWSIWNGGTHHAGTLDEVFTAAADHIKALKP